MVMASERALRCPPAHPLPSLFLYLWTVWMESERVLVVGWLFKWMTSEPCIVQHPPFWCIHDKSLYNIRCGKVCFSVIMPESSLDLVDFIIKTSRTGSLQPAHTAMCITHWVTCDWQNKYVDTNVRSCCRVTNALSLLQIYCKGTQNHSILLNPIV